jgi:hypothetical protein
MGSMHVLQTLRTLHGLANASMFLLGLLGASIRHAFKRREASEEAEKQRLPRSPD